MKWLNGACVTATLVAAFIVAIAPNLVAGVDVKLFSGFLEMRELVSEMQSKVPVTSEWAVVYCECKDGKVVALPVRGTAMEVDKMICEKEAAAHRGCRTEVRVMKISAPQERVEAYKKREEAAGRQRALEEERYRAWRAQQSGAPDSNANSSAKSGGNVKKRGSHELQWMTPEDFKRYQEEQELERKRKLKQEVKDLKDEAMKKVFENIIRKLP